MVVAVPIRPPASEPAPQLSCICCGSVSHLNPSHGPVLANRDEIEWQMLTQRDSYMDAICHQIGDHLPESLITFVLRVMSH
jgi:hypothetical protein